MSGFYGADVEQLRALGRDLTASAEQLDQIVARLGRRVDDVAWSGPDADRFRGDWHGAHSRSVRLVAGALRDAATAAGTNAAQQETASGASAGGLDPMPRPGPGAPIVPSLPGDFAPSPTLPMPVVPDPGDFVELPTEPLPELDPHSFARDMQYREGRDWVVFDGEPVGVRGRYDEGGAYIEVGDRRIYEGDADWPPITLPDRISAEFIPDTTDG